MYTLHLILTRKTILRAGDDVAEVGWRRRDDLSLDNLALASGRQVLLGYGRMRQAAGVKAFI